jgi:hypothetical protein
MVEKQPLRHNKTKTNPWPIPTPTRTPTHVFNHAAPRLSILTRNAVCALLRADKVVPATHRARSRQGGRGDGCVVSVLRLIVGDEASTIRKLTAEREVAEIPVAAQCRKQ